MAGSGVHGRKQRCGEEQRTQKIVNVSLETEHAAKREKRKTDMEINKKEYDEYVKVVTPLNNLWADMGKAFLVGGAICTVGQALNSFFSSRGAGEEVAAAWTILCLIALSVILTGLNLYPKLVKWGGAGALVPLTGFANSVVAPAIEYKAEGQVFGVGCKIFTIAGPVILYGIFVSWLLGAVSWGVGKLL